MKKFIYIISFFLFCTSLSFSQTFPKGTVKTIYVLSKALQNNKVREHPKRRVSIYLPPGYDANKKYPVIYYLHGFTWSDSLIFAADHMDKLLDKAIAQQRIRPFIMVTPDASTLYKGSFYTNSAINGNWSTFIAEDLVNYIDAHYSTIKDKNSRGLAGHSMGGHGALKVALLNPNRFSAVYALSPAILAADKEWMQDKKSVDFALQSANAKLLETDFSATLMVALGTAFSPNASKPPFYCDLPFSKQGNMLVPDDRVLQLWSANTPYALLASHVASFRGLKALAFDWGSQDQFKHIPATAKAFSAQLEAFGIAFSAQEYDGDHGNKIMTDDGRMLNNLLPFFDKNLSF
ncbi:MAG: esterase family protein [Chryseobacterium sp.]|nr:MAG: esterase family protein [Chryseobacterium sp.]